MKRELEHIIVAYVLFVDLIERSVLTKINQNLRWEKQSNIKAMENYGRRNSNQT